MIHLLFELCSVIVLIERLNCFLEGDDNVCFDAKLKAYFCCSHFEDINGTCFECNIGFKSRQGETCRPCPKNLYGYKCLFVCNCGDMKRCDNVQGCVSYDWTSTITHCETATTDSSTGILHINLMIYSVAATSIILMLVVCYVGRRIRKKVGTRIKTDIASSTEETATNNISVNEVTQSNADTYHTVNECNVEYEVENANYYINEVYDGTEHTLSINDATGSEYRHPYTSLIEISEIHTYDICQLENSACVESLTIDEAPKANQQLLSVQQSVEENSSCVLTNAIVHRSVADISDLEDEESDSGYLNPCPPIESGIQLDTKYVYDISVPGKVLQRTDDKSEEGDLGSLQN